MAMTLNKFAQLERQPLRKGVMENILREAKIMSLIPWENVDALDNIAVQVVNMPTVGFRNINEAYSDGSLGDTAQVHESIYIMGDDVDFDRIFKKVKNTIVDPAVFHMNLKSRALALTFNDMFINGDPTTNSKVFPGLKYRVTNMPARQSVYFAGVAGDATAPLDPTASVAAARAFLNKMDWIIKYCNGGKASALFCNEGVEVGFPQVIRYAQMSGGNLLDVTKDEYDREVITYKGVPFVDMGFKQDQTTEIIPNNETANDTGTDSTSVYAAHFGEDEGLLGIQLNPVEVYDPLNGGEKATAPVTMQRIEWPVGLASFGSRSLVRGRNLEQYTDWT